MLRHVIACLPIHGPADACMETAASFAAGYGSWLTGLVVREPAPPPYPAIANPMDPGFPSDKVLEIYREEMLAHERREDALQESLLQRFAGACRSRGVPGGTMVRTGDPCEQVAAAAVTADLVCVGRGQREGAPLGSTSGWLARHLARPVLIAGKGPMSLKKLAVAFDGSAASGRALSLAADIAKRWSAPLLVDVIHARGAGGPAGVLTEARRYLEICEVGHAIHEVEGPPARAVVSTASELGCDMLLMGAYGHSLVRELVLGSTTREVVSHWSKPLLLSR